MLEQQSMSPKSVKRFWDDDMLKQQSMSPKSVKRFWDDDMLKQQSIPPKSEDAAARGQQRSKTKTYGSFLNHFVRDTPQCHDAYAGHSIFQRNRV